MDDIRIDPYTAKDLVEAGAKLIDVRTDAEFAQYAVPGAVHVPLQELPQRIFDHIGHDDVVVLYCLSGGRSGRAAMWLREQGVAKAYNAGGVEAMAEAFEA